MSAQKTSTIIGTYAGHLLRTLERRLDGWADFVPLRLFPRRFGVLEFAFLLRVGSLEWLRRHRLILGELERLRAGLGVQTLRVLDFGGARGALAVVVRMYGLGRHYEISVADTDAVALSSAVLRGPLVSAHVLDPDGALPFEDASVDAVVSSDVFEHIPPASRARWAGETRRVACHLQVHSIPCDSADGRFRSTETDRRFAAWSVEVLGREEPWTAEHLAHGLPTIEEIQAVFRPTRLVGAGNVDVWFESVRVQFGPGGLPARFRFALRYALRERWHDRRRPFKGCLVVVERR